jgi:hypothetical protein
VRENALPERFQSMTTLLSASITRRFHFILAEAVAFHVTERRPMMNFDRDCFALNILGRPVS